jgi:alkanesulfonate monooxygenase SsuD/methylene tetrahydromethanopterin reductase-like flavin-dependent oxidoreductase (luciferase family)
VKSEQGFEEEWALVADAINAGQVDAAAGLISERYLDTLTVAGSPADVRSRVEEYLAAGVDVPIIGTAGDTAQAVDVLRALAPLNS